jgi:ADP-ribose pyrophosphatase
MNGRFTDLIYLMAIHRLCCKRSQKMSHVELPLAQSAPQYEQSDVELIARESAFSGFFKVDRYTLRHRLFAGGWSETMQREIFIRANATCVLPYDPVEGTVVLVEQFRAPLMGDVQSPWLIELVAGMNEVHENPVDVAHREAEEEAGLTLLDLEPILDYWVSPGGSTEKVYLFCARVDSRGVGGIHGLAEEHEDIRVHVLPFERAVDMMRCGRINNAAAIISLQWLQLNRSRLDQLWLNENYQQADGHTNR